MKFNLINLLYKYTTKLFLGKIFILYLPCKSQLFISRSNYQKDYSQTCKYVVIIHYTYIYTMYFKIKTGVQQYNIYLYGERFLPYINSTKIINNISFHLEISIQQNLHLIFYKKKCIRLDVILEK